MDNIFDLVKGWLSGIYFPKIQIIDIIEIIIIAVLVYAFMKWIKSTRAYMLLRGMVIVGIFILIAALFNMSTILWILSKVASVALIALVIIFQPELRRALESLGNKNFLSVFFADFGSTAKKVHFSDKTITELVRACTEMSEVKTGALIVIEQDILLNEYVETGIMLRSEISSQLLVNIFEKNTPLHDGAVIIRGNRIEAATCYLPLSENPTINKRLGTRHRAGIGISEVSDSFTIIVSEETGGISCAYEGALTAGLSTSALREMLHKVQNRRMNENGRKLRIWKGRDDDEETASE